MDSSKRHLFWVDSLKAFAIFGIILNHFVESFGSVPWFSNPSYDWPDLASRLSSVFPADGPTGWRIVQFLGWLGDMGPGIFILISGFTLTLSSLYKSESGFNIKEFYLKRLVRIFPLYMVVHLIVILSGVALNAGTGFDSSKVFLSMLGLRATDKLFFYINPSWWFIWLIIQLYLVFPFLYRLLTGKGLKLFIIITIGITLVSRLTGLLNFTWSERLEYWMTGIFAGTRLSEFAAGMILAKLLFENKFDPAKVNPVSMFLISLAMYACGFISSLFYFSTLISNILITLGLAGIFMTFSRIIESNIPVLINAVKWMGMASFPVFLLHQPLMLWTGKGFTGITKGMVELFVLVLAFPAGWLIDRAVNFVIRKIPEISYRFVLLLFGSSVILQFILNIVYFITGNELIYKADVILFIINVFFIPLYFFFRGGSASLPMKTLLLTFISASIVFLLILTKNWFSIFWIFLSLLLLFQLIISPVTKNIIYRLILCYLLVCTCFILTEFRLETNRPVEVNSWGELPALQKDKMTVYSLLPDKKTHLRYNNYDYYVKTNSFGFNGPEVFPGIKDSSELRIFITGDAFTMPEGMEFEKAYPWLLQIALSKRFTDKKIHVFNGGVTGYGPNEMYGSLLKYIDTLKPDIVINQIFINEFEEINLTEEQRQTSVGLRDLSLRERLFSGNQIPQQLKTGFHRLLKDGSFRKNTYNKSLIQFYEMNSAYYKDDNISLLGNYFTAARDLCMKKQSRFAVLYAPGQLEISSPDMISYYPYHIDLTDTLRFDLKLPSNTFEEICRTGGVDFLNPADTLRANPVQPVYFRDSWHWNEEGHKVIAEFLGKMISRMIEN